MSLILNNHNYPLNIHCQTERWVIGDICWTISVGCRQVSTSMVYLSGLYKSFWHLFRRKMYCRYILLSRKKKTSVKSPYSKQNCLVSYFITIRSICLWSRLLTADATIISQSRFFSIYNRVRRYRVIISVVSHIRLHQIAHHTYSVISL